MLGAPDGPCPQCREDRGGGPQVDVGVRGGVQGPAGSGQQGQPEVLHAADEGVGEHDDGPPRGGVEGHVGGAPGHAALVVVDLTAVHAPGSPQVADAVVALDPGGPLSAGAGLQGLSPAGGAAVQNGLGVARQIRPRGPGALPRDQADRPAHAGLGAVAVAQAPADGALGHDRIVVDRGEDRGIHAHGLEKPGDHQILPGLRPRGPGQDEPQQLHAGVGVGEGAAPVQLRPAHLLQEGVSALSVLSALSALSALIGAVGSGDRPHQVGAVQEVGQAGVVGGELEQRHLAGRCARELGDVRGRGVVLGDLPAGDGVRHELAGEGLGHRGQVVAGVLIGDDAVGRADAGVPHPLGGDDRDVDGLQTGVVGDAAADLSGQVGVAAGMPVDMRCARTDREREERDGRCCHCRHRRADRLQASRSASGGGGGERGVGARGSHALTMQQPRCGFDHADGTAGVGLAPPCTPLLRRDRHSRTRSTVPPPPSFENVDLDRGRGSERSPTDRRSR